MGRGMVLTGPHVTKLQIIAICLLTILTKWPWPSQPQPQLPGIHTRMPILVRLEGHLRTAVVAVRTDPHGVDPGDFTGGPLVKNLPSSAGDMSSIPHWRNKIPHAAGQLSPRTTTREACKPNKKSAAATKTKCSQKRGGDPKCWRWQGMGSYSHTLPLLKNRSVKLLKCLKKCMSSASHSCGVRRVEQKSSQDRTGIPQASGWWCGRAEIYYEIRWAEY